jgi:hypothetical protein
VKEYALREYAKPLIGRSIQAVSLKFTKNDRNYNNKSNLRSNLLIFPEKKNMKNNLNAKKYLKI